MSFFLKIKLGLLLLFFCVTAFGNTDKDLMLCEKEVTKRVLSVEVAGEPKYSKISFILDGARIEEAEMPDMTGESRRRRRFKRSRNEKIPPPQIGRRIQFEGEVIDKIKKQRIQARCLIYKGRVVTATFELDDLNLATTAIITTTTTTTTTNNLSP